MNKCLVLFIAPVLLIAGSCHNNEDTKTVTTIKCTTCQNSGSCVNDTCRCLPGTEGTFCETLSRNKYVGSWTVVEKGSATGVSQYWLSMETTDTSLATVFMRNFNNAFDDVVANINKDTITIPWQHNANKWLRGTGTLKKGAFGDTLFVRYQVVDSGVSPVSVNDFGYDTAFHSEASVWRR